MTKRERENHSQDRFGEVDSAFAEIQQLDIRVATAEAEEKNKCRTVKLDVLVD